MTYFYTIGSRLVQPLLLAHPLESMEPDDGQGVKRRHAVIFDPAGLNETPLKYTAGMVLAISVDAEVSNVADCLPMVRLAIKTPDQKVQLVTPKPTHFFSPRGDGSAGHRLLTDALMSHQARIKDLKLQWKPDIKSLLVNLNRVLS